MPFVFEETPLEGLYIITPKIFNDERGFFYENFKQSDFEKAGIKEKFIQDNHSFSVKNTIRGLHFQKSPHAQGKLVRCTRGIVMDVAVDLREKSKTFGKYYSIELSEENKKMFYLPPGFAHGFVVLSDTAEFLYKCTAEYAPLSDGGIRWDDPDIGVKWPLEKKDAIVSEKDSALPYLKDIRGSKII